MSMGALQATCHQEQRQQQHEKERVSEGSDEASEVWDEAREKR